MTWGLCHSSGLNFPFLTSSLGEMTGASFAGGFSVGSVGCGFKVGLLVGRQLPIVKEQEIE